MCGIVGFIGNDKALPKLIQGLKYQEYRGYDSAGVAYRDRSGNITICKAVGRVSVLEERLNFYKSANIGIGHTRWATHGGITKRNAHPHQVGKITIVHNGILENCHELKKTLEYEGYTFISDTDTEVACCYIDYLYSKNANIIEVLNECIRVFVGSYAIVGMVDDIKDKLFIIKKDSPLIVATGSDGNYIASDSATFSKNTYNYFSLEDGMVGIVMNNDIQIYKNNKRIIPKFESVSTNDYNADLNGFEHYMLKEMYEQKDLVKKWYKFYIEDNELNNLIDISKYKKIHIVGCGTAYHAGLTGKYLLEYYGNIEVNVFIASEYRYQKLFLNKDTLVIFISQSGETADTVACIKKVKEYNTATLGIVNVENSTIARLVDNVIYTKAFNEIAVASTKAYTAQSYVLGMLALRVGILNSAIKLENIKNTYKDLNILIGDALEYDYSPLINLTWNKEHIFYLGRNIDYVSMMEGALKLKEISYIHCEAMPAGELKHGSISLMNEESCVIVMATLEDLANKTISNVKEVKSRGAKVILFIRDDLTNNLDKDCYDELVIIPKTSYIVQPIVNVVYLQMLAYEVAKKLGKDIDKPRNLAKSVTVE